MASSHSGTLLASGGVHDPDPQPAATRESGAPVGTPVPYYGLLKCVLHQTQSTKFIVMGYARRVVS